MKQWYLVQVKPNSYRIAEKNLLRQGFKTFLPMQEVSKQKATRFVSILKPLFPGYMFVKTLENTSPLRKINSTLGVLRIVSFGGVAKPLDSQIVPGLMLRCDASGKLLPPNVINVGDEIEVTKGPFTNFVATVETIDADSRIWVLINLMGRNTKVGIDPNNVQLTNNFFTQRKKSQHVN